MRKVLLIALLAAFASASTLAHARSGHHWSNSQGQDGNSQGQDGNSQGSSGSNSTFGGGNSQGQDEQ